MSLLTALEKQRLRDAIRSAEGKTHGEIVTVIARRSGDYLYYPTLWAALIAIACPALALELPVSLGPFGIIELQLMVFVVLAALLRLPAIKMRLVPRAVQRLQAARQAREQFHAQGLHRTRQHSGILLFVSVAERYVEVIADEGIHKRVPAGSWDTLILRFTECVKKGEIGTGFIEAVNTIGDHLQTHFPADGANPNELPDHLVEL